MKSKMKKFILALLLAGVLPAKAQKYSCDSVAGDPMKARIYTLKNGLKIYMTQNDGQPRIQTYIAVRAGGKNDPHESTGLAHYLEHLMFKGTTSFGTQNYAAERPLLDSIRARYEVYGHTTDSAARRTIYHQIDSLSYAASKYAIANEYDKLMAGIGSNGSNAYTDVDVTCYIEDIPSNEVSRWARVQSERFQDLVIRGFHTELEAVYEEYNISLTRDFDKVDKTVNEVLYPHHPYGMQTVIGTQEHLKNPSLENVLRYYKTWYVPNNVAICMSGDLQNPDSIVGIIDTYFGQWKPNENLPRLTFPQEETIKSPIVREVIGRESEMVVLGWRLPGAKDPENDFLQIASKILANGSAGLFDIDLNQSQQVLASMAEPRPMSDYSTLYALALPKEGQTLEQVRDLMAAEVKKLRDGDFDEALLEAIINNMKRERMSLTESNERRADLFVQSFINGVDWKDQVEELDRLSKVTKQDVVDFANRYLTDGYVCVYKRQGEDPNEKKIDKPLINPIEMNRDKQSSFVVDVLNDTPHDIAPVFVDFEKDLSVGQFKNGNEFLYKHNNTNGLFQLDYIVDRGSKADPVLDVAAQYIQYLGTKKMDAEALQTELYRLACDVDFEVDDDRTTISISGLDENMEAAMKIAEDWMAHAQPDEEIYADMVTDILKHRQDSKLEQTQNYQRLVAYGIYGPDNMFTHQLSAEQLRKVTPAEVLVAMQNLRQVRQRIAYYGPRAEGAVKALVQKVHKTAKSPLPMGEDNDFLPQQVTEPEVLLAPYEAKNIYMRQYSNNGQVFSLSLQPQIELFNEYFGGGMNTIVFQELRESRGLAYNANAYYRTPSKKGMTNFFFTHIITQNDKMGDCLDVFHGITEQLPLSEASFSLAQSAILKRLATERVVRGQVLDYYLQCQDLGLDEDPGKTLYKKVSAMELDDLSSFHEQNVKNRTYRTMVLGDEKELDMEKLRSLGPIRKLTTEQIFGY